MKFAVIIAGIAQVASAHYFFDTSSVSGASSNKYIRSSTRVTKYNPIKFSSNPAADIRDGSYIDGPDARCNQGAFTNAGKTEVLTVAAGSEIRFKLGVSATMQHPGPGLMYMSRAPSDDVKSYDGSGDWFKIFEEGVCKQGVDFTSTAWCTWDRDWIAGTIPKNTPSGEYLVRVEHIGIHRSHVNQPEHYVSCAQVKVTGGGNGSPSPVVKFPGAYKDSDAYAKFSIYNGYKAFPMPGPAVWNGTGGAAAVGTTVSAVATVKPATSIKTSAAVPTTLISSVKPATSVKPTISAKPTTASAPTPAKPTTSAEQGGAALYAQCGGQTFAGATSCATGKCTFVNDWYSQCLN